MRRERGTAKKGESKKGQGTAKKKEEIFQKNRGRGKRTGSRSMTCGKERKGDLQRGERHHKGREEEKAIGTRLLNGPSS